MIISFDFPSFSFSLEQCKSKSFVCSFELIFFINCYRKGIIIEFMIYSDCACLMLALWKHFPIDRTKSKKALNFFLFRKLSRKLLLLMPRWMILIKLERRIRRGTNSQRQGHNVNNIKLRNYIKTVSFVVQLSSIGVDFMIQFMDTSRSYPEHIYKIFFFISMRFKA